MTATMTLVPNYNTIGVSVTWALSDDQNRSVTYPVLEYKLATEPTTWTTGFRMQRLAGKEEAHSTIFRLDADTEYDVRVTFSDSGDFLDGLVLEDSVTTRANPTLNTSPVRTVAVTDTTELAAALADATAGDDIVLAAGVYYTGDLTASANGTAANPITLRAESGATVILDGKDTASHTWSLYGTYSGKAMYQTTVSGYTNCRNVIYDGNLLNPTASLIAAQNFGSGTYDVDCFYQSGTTVYIHMLDGSNPTGHAVDICKYNRGITVSGDYWHIRDITFRNYGEDPQYTALYFAVATDCVVDGCKFVNTVGMMIVGACDRILVQNCEFYQGMDLIEWDAVKNRLEAGLGSHLGSGIRFTGSPGARQVVIRRNYFHDLFDGVQLNLQPPTGNLASNADVYENIFAEFIDDAIECDFYGKNVRIFTNRISGAHQQISFAKIYPGPAWVYDNVIYNIGNDQPLLQDNPAGAFKWTANKPVNVGVVFIFHNTIVGIRDHTDWGECLITRVYSTGVAFDGVDMRNNIFKGKDRDLRIDSGTAKWYVDYNCFRTPFKSRWAGTDYTSLAAFQAAGADQGNSISADPLFADESNYDFTLGGSSPAIGAAETINGINSHLAAGVRNMGALTTMADIPDGSDPDVPTPPPTPPPAPPPPGTGGAGEPLGTWTNDSANTTEYLYIDGTNITTEMHYPYNGTWTHIQFFKWDGYTTDESCLWMFIDQWTSSHAYQGYLRIDNGADPADLVYTNRNATTTTLSAVVDSGTWYCVVVTNDGLDSGTSLTMYLYSWDGDVTWTQDGKTTGDEGSSNVSYSNNDYIRLGNRVSGGSSSPTLQETMDGTLAFYAYLDIELSESQIEDMLDEGPIGYFEDHADLVALWDFDGSLSQPNTSGSGTFLMTVNGGNWDSSSVDGPDWPAMDDGEVKPFDLGLNFGLRMRRGI